METMTTFSMSSTKKVPKKYCLKIHVFNSAVGCEGINFYPLHKLILLEHLKIITQMIVFCFVGGFERWFNLTVVNISEDDADDYTCVGVNAGKIYEFLVNQKPHLGRVKQH